MMDDTRLTFTKKSFVVDDYAIKWPLSDEKMEKRENRTLLRDKYHIYQSFQELRTATLNHDMRVLAKWVQRGLTRDKALMINEPEVFTAINPINRMFELRVLQRAIKYDPLLEERYTKKGYKFLMLPKGQRHFELAVFNG
jgi:hypothetical protein